MEPCFSIRMIHPLEKIVDALFSTEEAWHGEEWMFKTANLDDTRLPSKENIIGIRDAETGESVAMTKEFVSRDKVFSILTVGNKELVLAYFPEYETIACFNKSGIGNAEITEIDVHGNTPQFGKLDREYTYNSALWAVWAFYYPDTKVLQ